MVRSRSPSPLQYADREEYVAPPVESVGTLVPIEEETTSTVVDSNEENRPPRSRSMFLGRPVRGVQRAVRGKLRAKPYGVRMLPSNHPDFVPSKKHLELVEQRKGVKSNDSSDLSDFDESSPDPNPRAKSCLVPDFERSLVSLQPACTADCPGRATAGRRSCCGGPSSQPTRQSDALRGIWSEESFRNARNGGW